MPAACRPDRPAPCRRVGTSPRESVQIGARVGTNWPANVTSGTAERATPNVTFAGHSVPTRARFPATRQVCGAGAARWCGAVVRARGGWGRPLASITCVSRFAAVSSVWPRSRSSPSPRAAARRGAAPQPGAAPRTGLHRGAPAVVGGVLGTARPSSPGWRCRGRRVPARRGRARHRAGVGPAAARGTGRHRDPGRDGRRGRGPGRGRADGGRGVAGLRRPTARSSSPTPRRPTTGWCACGSPTTARSTVRAAGGGLGHRQGRHPQRRGGGVRAGRAALRRHGRRRAARARPGPGRPRREDPPRHRGRGPGPGQPVRHRRLQPRPPQRAGPRVRPGRHALRGGVRAEPVRRGQPDHRGRQLRLARGGGRRGARRVHRPAGDLVDRRGVAERARLRGRRAVRRGAARRAAVEGAGHRSRRRRHAGGAAHRRVRPAARGGADPGRCGAVGDHEQPRRPRRAGAGRRPDRGRSAVA